MKLVSLKESGQALILIAFGAIALFAITGLAIDGSHKYSDRRHAQNAADTAAIAAALSLARDPTGVVGGVPAYKWAAIQRAGENGYNRDLVKIDVDVYNPPDSGIYNDCSDVHFDCHDYVQVVIRATRPTWFMRVLGITEFTNVVTAVASTIAENNNFTFGGNAVVALAPTSCDPPALMAQGGSDVTIYGGGMYSNSDESVCAFHRQSCPSGTLNVYTDPSETTQSNITMVGSTTSACISTHAVFQSGAKQIPFPPPYQEIAEPDQCSKPVDLAANYTVTGSGSSKIVNLRPGHYSKWPLNGQWNNSMILEPGVYCIDTAFNSPGNITVSGTGAGVFIYIRSGGSFTFNSTSNINLWGINSNNDASDVDKYKGFLMYVAPDYSTGTPRTCQINGTAGYKLIGTIYAPYCAITINGSSDTVDFRSQVIGYTVKFAGGANVVLTYNAGDNHIWTVPLQVGLSK